MVRLRPPQLLILSFLFVILLGTAVLSLPQATSGEGKLSLVDSLFTATSATCVTGLVVKETGSYFSTFGRWVIFALFQAGGLGIMTFSTLFAVMLGKKIGFHETDIIRSTLDRQSIVGLKKLILYIVGITVVAEGVGALFLFLRWRVTMTWGILETLENAVFHSVSAFCNAGFSLFNKSFTQFQSDPFVNVTMIFLIFLGGIGFIVILDMLGLFYKKGQERKLSLHSKIVLLVSGSLIVLGAVMILFLEKDNVLSALSWPGRIWGAVFQSVTARTAGFNTLPIGQMGGPALMFIVFLMFVGASPGSTGGGIKTCTFAVIGATIFSMMKNKRHVRFFNRSIPERVVRESLVIFFLALLLVFISTMVLLYFESGKSGNGSFIGYLFEVVSAFGTVGLSTGLTAGLSSAGKICMIVTMFAGRVGPLTLALAIAFREKRELYVFPEEDVMVG